MRFVDVVLAHHNVQRLVDGRQLLVREEVVVKQGSFWLVERSFICNAVPYDEVLFCGAQIDLKRIFGILLGAIITTRYFRHIFFAKRLERIRQFQFSTLKRL